MSLDKLEKFLKDIEKLIVKLEEIKEKKSFLENKLDDLKKKCAKKKIDEDEFKRRLNEILKGKDENSVISNYNDEIRSVVNKIKFHKTKIMSLFKIKIEITKEENVIDPKDVRKYLKSQKSSKDLEIKDKYVVHDKNVFGQIANKLFKEIAIKLTRKYPEIFKELYNNLRISNMKMFSDTYISVALLGSVLFFAFSYILLLLFGTIDSTFSFIQYFFIAVLLSLIFLVCSYYYPKVVIDNRRREIKNDLPFAIMHMAAIAGSGAPLVSAFDMLLKSGEYKALSGEIKRILNYVNLFGYSLSVALKSVSETTPSREFRELLNGMRSTIETGGDLKLYLKEKAGDTFITYKNDRKRYVEVLSTYSDIYTAVLIAAPLLFIIVLVLISFVGDKLGGFDIQFIERLGIFVVLPAFNIAFIVFINIVQPEM